MRTKVEKLAGRFQSDGGPSSFNTFANAGSILASFLAARTIDLSSSDFGDTVELKVANPILRSVFGIAAKSS